MTEGPLSPLAMTGAQGVPAAFPSTAIPTAAASVAVAAAAAVAASNAAAAITCSSVLPAGCALRRIQHLRCA